MHRIMLAAILAVGLTSCAIGPSPRLNQMAGGTPGINPNEEIDREAVANAVRGLPPDVELRH